MSHFNLSEVLDEIVKRDLVFKNRELIAQNKLDKKAKKILRKRYLHVRKEQMKKDPIFNRIIRDVCKFGWEGAERKILLRRNFDNVLGC